MFLLLRHTVPTAIPSSHTLPTGNIREEKIDIGTGKQSTVEERTCDGQRFNEPLEWFVHGEQERLRYYCKIIANHAACCFVTSDFQDVPLLLAKNSCLGVRYGLSVFAVMLQWKHRGMADTPAPWAGEDDHFLNFQWVAMAGCADKEFTRLLLCWCGTTDQSTASLPRKERFCGRKTRTIVITRQESESMPFVNIL